MNRRTTLTLGTAAGGLLATAFLQAAVAVAAGGADSPSDNAFAVGDFTFDPGKDGFDPISPLSQVSPLLEIGGGSLNDTPTDVGLAQQSFTVYDSDGTDVGTVTTNVNAQDLFGAIDSTQLTVTSVSPTGDATASDLPAVGTVYSVTDLGGGLQNVYEAVPGSGDSAANVTDTLVTPFGNTDLSSLFGDFDATKGVNPGDAFTDFGAAGAGTDDLSGNAFTIGSTTFDPGADGFGDANPLFGVAPLLALGGGTATLPGFAYPLDTQDLTVSGSDGNDLGTVATSVNTSNILGIHSTQFTVTGSTPADGVDADQLPTDGTVYSVTNLGGGIDNVYEAVPGKDGGSAAITDTLVTPFGNTDLSSLFAGFDATGNLDPGAALGGLGADGGAGDLSDNAFTIGDDTFDPGSDGFTGVTPIFGVAPLLEIGGGSLAGTALAPQSLDVYGSDGTDLGTVDTGVNVSNVLGIETTEFTVTGSDAAEGVDADQLPADGTVYSVTDLGNGYENIYEAVPGSGSSSADITDTLVTPFGNFDLSSLFGGFDATADINPGDVFGVGADAGGDAGGSAGDAAADPLSFLGF
jgi:hypothetical protein